MNLATGPLPPKRQQVILPVTRIKTIMKTNVKSSQSSLNVGQDSVMVIAKATVSSTPLNTSVTSLIRLL